MSWVLKRKTTGLLVIDVQERLLPHIDRASAVLDTIQKVIKGFQVFQLPILLTEQYPKGLGSTIPTLSRLLFPILPFSKTTFSCLGDPIIREKVLTLPVTHWVLVGIEAHVCVWQTACDLLEAGRQVVVVDDAVASRANYDFLSAVSELKQIGARVSSSETILFEILKDSKNEEFKQITELIKSSTNI